MTDTSLFNRLNTLYRDIKDRFDAHLTPYENEKHVHEFEGWTDSFWKSESIRKCHLKVIEPAGKNKKLWLMHINVFPQVNRNLPILGLDVVATENKISGCFFDFSPLCGGEHPYMNVFEAMTSRLSWNRPRELPPWAKEIFSRNMIAAGSVREGEEAEQLCDASLKLIDFYLAYVNDDAFLNENLDTTKAQNNYCKNQKMNKQLYNSLSAMGIESEKITQYVENVLFEEM